jgi:hypothetical protein
MTQLDFQEASVLTLLAQLPPGDSRVASLLETIRPERRDTIQAAVPEIRVALANVQKHDSSEVAMPPKDATHCITKGGMTTFYRKTFGMTLRINLLERWTGCAWEVVTGGPIPWNELKILTV